MPKGDWIPIFHDLPDSPPVLAICEATGAPLDVIVGRLTLVWLMVDRSTTDGKLAGVGPNALATRIGGDAAFWQAVAVVGWITFTDGGVEIPHKYFGATCRARLLDALRKRTKRTETGQRPDRDRTRPGRAIATTTPRHRRAYCRAPAARQTR